MTPNEHIEEMGMTISMMGAELLATKKELKGSLADLEEAQQKSAEWEKNARTEYRIHNEVQDKNRDLRAELAEAQQEIDRLKNLFDEDTKELIEAQQTIARLTAALIAERDDALTWDGIGTVNRINKVLEGNTQP